MRIQLEICRMFALVTSSHISVSNFYQEFIHSLYIIRGVATDDQIDKISPANIFFDNISVLFCCCCLLHRILVL